MHISLAVKHKIVVCCVRTVHPDSRALAVVIGGTAAAGMIVSSLQVTRETQVELTEFMVLASAVLAVITELPVSSTACRAFRITVLLPMWVTLLMGTTQCLQ